MSTTTRLPSVAVVSAEDGRGTSAKIEIVEAARDAAVGRRATVNNSGEKCNLTMD